MHDADPNQSIVDGHNRAHPRLAFVVLGLLAIVLGLAFVVWSERNAPPTVEPGLSLPQDQP